MESKGTLVGVARNWENGFFQLTFELEKDVANSINDIKEHPLTITAKRYRERRSLDANAYYWQLLTKLADSLQYSKPYVHNLMLRRYGCTEIIDGQMVFLVLPDTDSGARIADEAETYHIRPTTEVKPGKDGMMYRTYVMLRGSSSYDTAEMSTLINGLVSECKQQGIETLPPEELERMMQAYETNWRRRHETP